MSKKLPKCVPVAEFIASAEGYTRGIQEAIALVLAYKEGDIGLDYLLGKLRHKVAEKGVDHAAD